MTRTHMVDTGSPVVEARSAGNSFVNSRAFEVLARAGFVARGIVYGIIGVLALDVAVGHGGKLTNQQGALRAVEEQRFGNVLLTLLAIGLGGYSLWRLFRAILGHGPEGADRGLDRLGALGSGIVYAVMCMIAIQLLVGSSGVTGSAEKTASGAFSWPGGRWLVGIAGLVLIGVGVYQLIRGVRRKFLDDSKTEEMSPTHEDVDHMDRHRGPRCACSRVRTCRRLPRQGRGGVLGEGSDRPRRRPRQALQPGVRPLAAGRGRRGPRRVRNLLAERGALPPNLTIRVVRPTSPRRHPLGLLPRLPPVEGYLGAFRSGVYLDRASSRSPC